MKINQIDNRQRIGMWAATILFIGGFTPVFPLSFGYNDCSYFQNIDSLLIFVIMIPAGCWLLVYFEKYKILEILGYLLFVWHLIILSLWPLYIIQNSHQKKIELESDSINRLGDALGIFANQIQWGWIVLFAGSLMIVYCSKMEE